LLKFKPKLPPIAFIGILQWYRYEMSDELRVVSLDEERNEVDVLLQNDG